MLVKNLSTLSDPASLVRVALFMSGKKLEACESVKIDRNKKGNLIEYVVTDK